MFRTNAYSAETQMVRCTDCGEHMNAIYSRDARETCYECGGVAKRDSIEDLKERRRA